VAQRIREDDAIGDLPLGNLIPQKSTNIRLASVLAFGLHGNQGFRAFVHFSWRAPMTAASRDWGVSDSRMFSRLDRS